MSIAWILGTAKRRGETGEGDRKPDAARPEVREEQVAKVSGEGVSPEGFQAEGLGIPELPGFRPAEDPGRNHEIRGVPGSGEICTSLEHYFQKVL